ncbi:hypothetical protein BHE74_00021103 [Ensete ventricosum]|nr:hypothetical protein GW17_00059088 [Ensete ventricosum]RWW71171.1 hypothetical protein BHE74_00021103 [Ensete ventricosum]
MVSMSLMRGQPKVGGGCPDTTSSTPITPQHWHSLPTPPSPSEVQEIPPKAIRKLLEASSKRPIEAPIGQRKKAKVPNRHKPHREGEKSKSRATKARSQPPQLKGRLLGVGYQLALARFWAQYPNLEIEEDPFKLLPEDLNVLMVDEQPFDDSLLPPEE